MLVEHLAHAQLSQANRHGRNYARGPGHADRGMGQGARRISSICNKLNERATRRPAAIRSGPFATRTKPVRRHRRTCDTHRRSLDILLSGYTKDELTDISSIADVLTQFLGSLLLLV